MSDERCPVVKVDRGCTVRPYLVERPEEWDSAVVIALNPACRGMEMVGAMDDDEYGLVALFERRGPARRRG